MAYESLYRRYRPQRFSEVRGQDHVITALHNAVRENRVGHAYLLSGPRGTGKTSTARILAKALNCTDLDDGEPCGVCDSCKAIESGTSYDLLELDAASNNGVDAMRDLIAKAALGSPGRTKVYLLDEVHMLSAGASNALLKTLEEPPGHVVFVLATTDPHKVLPTIRSRTQHYALHLLTADELRALVDEVATDAGLTLDDAAIEYALRTGGGSARDTLSALDQVVAAGGVLDQGDQVDELVDALAAGDTAAALRSVSDAVGRGRDPRIVGEALLARIRDVFLHRMGDPLEQATDAERAKSASWAEAFSDRTCTRILEAIGDALREMRTAPDARIPLEVALVRLTRTDTDISLESLAVRIERLERGAGPGAPPSTHAAATATAPTSPGSPPPPTESAMPGSSSGRPADAARAAIRSGPPRETPPPTTPSRPGAPKDRAPAPPPVEPDGHRSGPSTPDGPLVAPRRATAPSEPEPTGPSPDGARSTSPPVSRSAVAGSPHPPAGSSPRGEEPAATTADSSASVPTTTTADSSAGRTDLETTWTEQVLPRLSGLTKAMFSVGHFVDTAADASTGRARFAVPNEVHREKSLQKLAEVEGALAAVLGHPLTLELVVDAPHGRDGRDERASTDATGPAPQTDEEALDHERADIGPIDELDDAPADDRSAAQRLLDAFPGAEIIDP